MDDVDGNDENDLWMDRMEPTGDGDHYADGCYFHYNGHGGSKKLNHGGESYYPNDGVGWV